MKPVIGERYRDTAREIAGVTHIERFRAARAMDAAREDLLMRAIVQRARSTGATLGEIESARVAGIAALNKQRSVACAISEATTHLPRNASPRPA
jgi:hypothetical protein